MQNKPKTLKTQIVDKLRGRILAQEWAEGTRLKEEDLAKEFGVSRGPIRDVVLELTKEGVLQFQPNKGASVCRLPDADARKILIRTRRDLEALALKKGFQTWEKGDFAEMERLLMFFRVAADSQNLAEVIEYDLAFHRFIVDRHPAGDLGVIWQTLMSTLALPYSRHRNLIESYEEHVVIWNALKKGEVKEAIICLKAHIQ